MRDYEQQDHIERVPHEVSNSSRPLVYLPHHAVKKEDSTTTKLRVVFNASNPTSSSLSLNDVLLPGRKLQNDLSQVLLQWRMFKYVFTADIAQMYRQIRIQSEDRDFQRLVWRYDPREPVEDFRLTTVTFGVNCSPYLALRVITQLAIDEGKEYPLAAPVLNSGLYVDDVLFRADDLVMAKQIREQLTTLLLSGGFHLRKWASNSVDLLNEIDPNDHGLACEKPLSEGAGIKILGIYWNPLQDSFQFTVNPDTRAATTKRIMLSVIAKIYDPLGWVSPLIIQAKILIQSLWLLKVGWDEVLPDHVIQQWSSIWSHLATLTGFTIPRWVHSSHDTVSMELIGFCDASKAAYAAVIYMRVTSVYGQINVSLLESKTRVAPLKRLTIPKLELAAAALLTDCLVSMRSTNSTFATLRCHCWTDSTIVLDWLKKHPSQCDVFVGNRVSKIQNSLPTACWHHVPSQQNPADLASRGTSAADLIESSLWLHGPDWVSLDQTLWPRLRKSNFTDEDDRDEEVVVQLMTSAKNDTLETLSTRISSWNRLMRITAYSLIWICRIRDPELFEILPTTPSAREIREATTKWVLWLQAVQLPEELTALQSGNHVSKRSSILSLNPVIDEDGAIKVGGRLQHANLDYDIAHPIILRSHPVVKLLVENAHRRCLHGGLSLTLRTLRESFWILQGKKLIKSVIFKCIVCTRMRAELTTQLMGQLPAPRVIQPPRPFYDCGVDYAGPVQVRTVKGRGHKSHNAYICIFVCFATKAIHLELVSDYSSSSFIATFKRFVSRRGIPHNMYSDCGTTFVGASAELREVIGAAIEHSDFAALLATDNINWHFTPPAAPHFGGLWEAGVRSVKFHLKRVLRNQTPTFEELVTVLCEVEAMLNSHPLTALTESMDDLSALTPGHFLIGSALAAIPERSTSDQRTSAINRWKLYRDMIERFWRLWSRDYILSLQHRTKWHLEHDNIRIGELVLINTPNLPPTKWPLARVI